MFDYMQSFTSPALQAQFDAQLSLALDLSNRILSGAQKIHALNAQVVQTLLKESLTTTQQFLASFNKDVAAPAAEEPPPVTEKIRAYQQHLQNIFSETQNDVVKTIESHVPETVRAAEIVVTEVVQKVSEETMKAAELQKQAFDHIAPPTQ